MKKIICVSLVALGLVALLVIAKPGMAATEFSTVTGAGRTTFTSSAIFNSITLSSCDVGTGVFVDPNGSASGAFNAVLLGRPLLGQSQQILIDGTVLKGVIAPDGRAYLSGIATVNSGNGLSLQGVPFKATMTANSLLLTIGSTSLPVAQLTAGSIIVE